MLLLFYFFIIFIILRFLIDFVFIFIWIVGNLNVRLLGVIGCFVYMWMFVGILNCFIFFSVLLVFWIFEWVVSGMFLLMCFVNVFVLIKFKVVFSVFCFCFFLDILFLNMFLFVMVFENLFEVIRLYVFIFDILRMFKDLFVL